jgi:hypothetical protein
MATNLDEVVMSSFCPRLVIAIEKLVAMDYKWGNRKRVPRIGSPEMEDLSSNDPMCGLPYQYSFNPY